MHTGGSCDYIICRWCIWQAHSCVRGFSWVICGRNHSYAHMGHAGPFNIQECLRLRAHLHILTFRSWKYIFIYGWIITFHPSVYYKKWRFGGLNGWEWGIIWSLMTASCWLCGCHWWFCERQGVEMLDHILGWLITVVSGSEELVEWQLGPHKILERQKIMSVKNIHPSD